MRDRLSLSGSHRFICNRNRLHSKIPQYVEVPPDMEAIQIISYFSAVLSNASNPLLLRTISNFRFYLFYWQATCRSLHDPGYLTQKRVFIVL